MKFQWQLWFGILLWERVRSMCRTRLVYSKSESYEWMSSMRGGLHFASSRRAIPSPLCCASCPPGHMTGSGGQCPPSPWTPQPPGRNPSPARSPSCSLRPDEVEQTMQVIMKLAINSLILIGTEETTEIRSLSYSFIKWTVWPSEEVNSLQTILNWFNKATVRQNVFSLYTH